jgi:pyrroline-5-carboxylate reductase
MKTNTIGFIGGGRITKIMLQAFVNKSFDFGAVKVFDVNSEIAAKLKEQFSFVEIADNSLSVFNQQTVFIALHPPVIMEWLNSVENEFAKENLIISLAPKITIEKLSAKLNTSKTVRFLPNATSYINEGYNPITFSHGIDIAEKESVMKLLGVFGEIFEVPESKIEAYALMSAMLPTYFWFQWDKLTKLGVQMGLTGEESKTSVERTTAAALKTMFQSGLSPEEVMDLIPVKPLGSRQQDITEFYNSDLLSLYEKIKP